MTDRLREYIDKLEKIREEKMMSKLDMCKQIDVTYMTMEKILKRENIAFKTVKKIKNYVDEYEM